MQILIVITICHQDSCFLSFMNYLKLLGPLDFSSLCISSFLRVFDSSSNSSLDELIFFYNFYVPYRSFRLLRIYLALFWRTALFPLMFWERFFKNLSSDSYALLFWIISANNLMESSEICPFSDWVWWQSSSSAPSFHLDVIKLSPRVA